MFYKNSIAEILGQLSGGRGIIRPGDADRTRAGAAEF